MAMARAMFDTSGAIHPGYARLTEFINITSSKVDIFNKYTDAQLEAHTRYLQDFVRSLCKGFGQYQQVYKMKKLIPRGSYFEKNKIVSPTEYDFLIVLALSVDPTVKVCGVPERCGVAGQGYGVVNIYPGQLQQQLLHLPNVKDDDGRTADVLVKHPHSEDITHASQYHHSPPSDVYWLTEYIKYRIRDTMNTYLRNTYGSLYLGERDHKKEQHPSYTLGEFTMHEYLHGPSVWLRVGAPLGTTDIDLCYCIEKHQGNVIVPVDPGGCGKCPHYIHWTESVVQTSPPAHDHQLHIPTGHHKQLFLTLKYISHLYNRIHWFFYHRHPVTGLISSYSYKLLVMNHQQHCTGSDFYIGRCYESIVEYIFNQLRYVANSEDDDDSLQYRDDDYSDKYIVDYGKVIYLPDTHYPDRKVRVVHGGFNIGEFIVLLWLLRHIKHSIDTQWWEKLLHDDFPNNVSSSDVLLQSLLDSVTHVCDYKREPLEWHHEDDTRTHFTFRT